MGMGNQYVANGFSLKQVFERVDVLFDQWPRVDDSDIAPTDNIGAGTMESETTGIGRCDAAYEWCQFFQHTIGVLVFEDKRDSCRHDSNSQFEEPSLAKRDRSHIHDRALKSFYDGVCGQPSSILTRDAQGSCSRD